MIQYAHSGNDYEVHMQYVINRGTKGHRTLHKYNNPACYPSRQALFRV